MNAKTWTILMDCLHTEAIREDFARESDAAYLAAHMQRHARLGETECPDGCSLRQPW